MTKNNEKALAKVLCIENDKNMQFYLSQVLQIMGYEVACADNGLLGIDKAKEWRPDIILMDIRMPVMDGVEATRILRSQADTAQIPIFILSVHIDGRTRRACRRAGADCLFIKIPPLPILDAAIKEGLKKQDLEPASRSAHPAWLQRLTAYNNSNYYPMFRSSTFPK